MKGKGFFAIKQGMETFFRVKGGLAVPATSFLLVKNTVCQVKNQENDGYNAYQVIFPVPRSRKKRNACWKGHLKSNKVFLSEHENKHTLMEVRWNKMFKEEILKPNETLKPNEILKVGSYVDVVSRSKGKGFQGRIKAHNQSRGPSSHGSGHHRQVGSTGSIAPNRVFKNQKLPKRIGNKRVTTLNTEVLRVDHEKNTFLLLGSTAGNKKQVVFVRESKRK